MAGSFLYTVNFRQDFGGTDSKTSAGGADIFVTKINAGGTYGWTRSAGGSSSDDGFDLIVDAADDIYVCGTFGSYMDFGQDFGTTDQKTGAGGYDVFLVRLKVISGVYVLDGYGGLHAGGGASVMNPAAPYFGWNIARSLALYP